ncbi:methyltransferase domain-containing protein, partial [Bacteroidales bacterium OttesenSCG-928-E04]|nr:methyltransferase domain-containing protein [Bacteroidales bacterium OttesenSCG-928-E04]
MFRFKNFSLSHHRSTLKIGTDSVLLSALVPIGHKTNILDIGTGCGIIAFCLADKHRKLTIPPTQILGIDIDKDSIKEADENNSTFPPIQNLSVNFRK